MLALLIEVTVMLMDEENMGEENQVVGYGMQGGNPNLQLSGDLVEHPSVAK